MFFRCFPHAVPIPSVTVSISSGNLYVGSRTPLTLTCDVDFDPTLTTFVNVSVTWWRGTSLLSHHTDRVSIVSSLNSTQFTSSLTLYPLLAEDSTNFTCRAGIIPTDDLTSITASDLRDETVQVILQGQLLICTIIVISHML